MQLAKNIIAFSVFSWCKKI